jgi:putative transposon-encoded protein
MKRYNKISVVNTLYWNMGEMISLEVCQRPKNLFISTLKPNKPPKLRLYTRRKLPPFGTSAKVGAPMEYVGKRAYVIISKE